MVLFLAGVFALLPAPDCAQAVGVDLEPFHYFADNPNDDAGHLIVDALKIIVVPDDYATIQEAIDAAGPGDRVLIKNGVYTEIGLNITDKVGLEVIAQVAGQVVLAGDNSLPVLTVKNVNGLLVRGLDLKKGTQGVEISGTNKDLTFDDVDTSDLTGNGFSVIGAIDYKLNIKNSVIEFPAGKDGLTGSTIKGPTGEVSLTAVGWSGGRNAARFTSVETGARFLMDGSTVAKIGSQAISMDKIEGYLRISNSTLYRLDGVLKASSISGEVTFARSRSNHLKGHFLECTSVGGKISWQHLKIDNTAGYIAKVQTLTGEFNVSNVDVIRARSGMSIGVVETNAKLTYTLGKLSGLDKDLLEVQELKGTIAYSAVDAEDIGRFSRINSSSVTGELSYRLGTLKQGREENMFELFGDARYNLESSRMESYGGGIRYRPDSSRSWGLRMDSIDMGGRGGRDTRFGLFFQLNFDDADSILTDSEHLLQVTNCGFVGFDSAVILEGGDGFISNCSFVDNYVGVDSRVTGVEVQRSYFGNNTHYAAMQVEECPPLSALECDWGDISGPLDASADTALGTCGNYNPDGGGDEVGDYVDYGDFLDETPHIEMILELLGSSNPLQNEAVPARATISNEGETRQVLSFWLETSRPKGLPTFLIPQFVLDCANPRVVELMPGETETFRCVGVIPPHEPPGKHVITAYVGYYASQVFSEDSFELNIGRDPSLTAEDDEAWIESLPYAGGLMPRTHRIPNLELWDEPWD